jgi:hypothetical protein
MINRSIKLVLLTIIVVLLPAINAHAEEIKSTLLIFKDQDLPSEEPYITRMLLTDDYLRMDDGEDHGDFALFDRKAGAIYSVSHEDQRILVVPAQPVTVSPPRPLRNDIEEHDAKGAPAVGGNKVSRYYLFTNGARCMEIFAVQDYYSEVVSVLAEFSKTLAGQHARTIALMPDEIQNDCDMANNVFYPDRHLNKGFPIHQIDFSGRSRMLVDIDDDYKVGAGLFVLPEGYEKFMPGGLNN